MLTSSDVSKYKDKVESVVIGEGITELKSNDSSYDGTFREFNKLKSVTFKVNSSEGISSLKTIGDNAFYGCTNLESITIPNSVTTIRNYAFRYCTLKSITIPKSVTSISNVTFFDMDGCEKIIVDGENANYASDDDGVLFTKDMKTLIHYPQGKAFAEIKKNPNGLVGYTIPDGVTTIGAYAFDGGYEYGGNKDYCPLTSIEIPDSVTTIEKYAFTRCTQLKSIIIPQNVESIGDWVFYKCTKLESITIPKKVKSIGEWAFCECTNLESIIIPQEVESIKNNAFNGCSGLTSITIPQSVTTIGKCAFYECNNLKNVCYEGTEEQWGKISIGNNNDKLKEATLYYNHEYKNTNGTELTLTKKWQDGNNGDKRGKPEFGFYIVLNNDEFKQLSCKYTNSSTQQEEDVFDENGEITKGAKEVGEWVYKFVIYDYDAKKTYAVDEKPMAKYESSAPSSTTTITPPQ